MPDKKQAREDYALKLRFEKSLLRKLRKLNVRMTRQFARSVSSIGIIPNLNQFQDDFEKMLLDHYRRVGRRFTDRITEQVRAEQKSLTPVVETKAANLSIVVSKYYDVSAASQALKITETNKKNAADALKIAREAFAGTTVEELNIANTATSVFRQKLKGRELEISLFETNHSSKLQN